MSSYRSCVVAHGARTPVGLTAPATAAAVRAGISRLAGHPRYYDVDGEAIVVGMDRTLEEFDSRKRMLALATSALRECLEPLAVPPKTMVPVFLGVRETALGFTREDAAWLALALFRQLEPHNRVKVTTVEGGSASGLYALQRARQAVETGVAPLAVAGGVDSHLDPSFLERIDEEGRCKSPANKWGYPPGEGAGMLAVCTTGVAKSLGRPPLAGLLGGGYTTEPAHFGTESVCTGEGLAEALRSTISALSWPREVVATTYCDINGEFHRTEEFMYATQRLPANAFRAIEEFVGPADCWGDVGAASGPLFASLAIESGRRGYARGPHVLLWASSDNGQRAASLLELP